MEYLEDKKIIDNILEEIQSAIRSDSIDGNYRNNDFQKLTELRTEINHLIDELSLKSKQGFKQKKSFYISILEQIPIGIAVLDKHAKYIYCNPAFFQNPELSVEALGLTDVDLHKKNLLSKSVAFLRYQQARKAILTRQVVSEKEIVDISGVEKKYLRVVSPFVYSKSSIPHFALCYLLDITRFEKREESLNDTNVHLERSKGELYNYLQHISHDLRAPLSSIDGLINISSHAKDMNELQGYMSMIKKNVHQLEEFIKNILNYSTNGNKDISYKAIDFHEEVNNVISSLRYIENAQRINFNIDVSAEHEFHSDSVRLYIILNNLISNAIKYHNYDQPQPFIHVLIKADEHTATLKIVDNGQGISKKDQPKLFKSFEKVAENSKGSGLGLFLVKEVVQKLKGEISFESVFNKGTSFEIKIPNALNEHIINSQST